MSAEDKSVVLSCGTSVRLSGKRPLDSREGDAPGGRLIERVNNVWGSTAGAGSDFFHTYRKHRAVEMQRLKKLDEQHDEEQEALEFQEK